MQTWKDFSARNKGLHRTKVVRVLNALVPDSGATFTAWHDEHDGLATSYTPANGEERALFRTDLLGRWLRQSGIGKVLFLREYKPRRCHHRAAPREAVPAAASKKGMSLHKMHAPEYQVEQVRTVLGLTFSDELKLKMIEEVVA